MRLQVFHTKNPSARKDPLIVWLSLMNSLRCFPFLALLLAGISARIDYCLSLNCVFVLLLSSTFIVCLPSIQKKMLGLYGGRSLRILGWNGPEITAIKTGAVVLGSAATIVVAT